LIQPIVIPPQKQPEPKPVQAVQPIPGVISNPTNNFAGQKVGPQRASIQKLNPQSYAQILGQQPAFQSLPLDDPVALKMDAAIKQSIADRTGDLSLREQARIEQSLADKTGGRQILLNKSFRSAENLMANTFAPISSSLSRQSFSGRREAESVKLVRAPAAAVERTSPTQKVEEIAEVVKPKEETEKTEVAEIQDKPKETESAEIQEKN